MMYVVPHGDRLSEYQLPENPVVSPTPLAALGLMRRIGAVLFGFGLLSTALHFLAFGPKEPEPAAPGDAPDAGE